MAITVVIALCVLTIATFTNSLGFILMKQAVMHLEQTPEKRLLQHPKYLMGFGCLVLGAIVLIVSLSYADMVTLSSISALDLVFNSLLSRRMLKEEFTKYDLIASIMIGSGAFICAMSSSLEVSNPTYDDLLHHYFSAQSIILILGTVGFAIWTQVYSKKILAGVTQFFDKVTLKWESNSECGLATESDQRTKVIIQRIYKHYEDEKLEQPKQQTENKSNEVKEEGLSPLKEKFDLESESTTAASAINDQDSPTTPKAVKQYSDLPTRFLIKFIACLQLNEIKEFDNCFNSSLIRLPLFLYPWTAGFLSSLTTSLIKGVSTLVNSSDLWSNLSRPMIYFLLIFVLISLVNQLRFINMGFKNYDQMEIIPIYQSSIIINNVLFGGIMYNEFARYVWWKLIILCVGFVICLTGILIIIKKNQLQQAKMTKIDSISSPIQDQQPKVQDNETINN